MHPWIENVTLRPPATSVTVLPPDPATTVVWRMTRAGESDVLVAGPRTTAAYHATKDLPVCVRLRIRPGRVLPLLGAAADELVDRTVPLGDLIGPTATTLAERLVSSKDEPEQAVEVLGDFLLGQLPRRLPDRLELVGQAVAELASPCAVGETARRLGVSERYLRRVFREAVGVSPKQFARITRVRTVIAQARRSWSDVAAYAGYTDQSHLIADFRSLMRVTPTAYATGRVPLSTC
ncbi:helix-turn-helix domain-containing protein [Kribbella speibonae]|uniref:AraC family transcriptional regulator n=1 Tax=Kribbella speibonae TaxID=1572660 RepID=A0A4R0J6V8_9ACTN|nr:helix-turn-helix transcriptional regulator [Kribbella speibonae]TCC42231.1 AraC family transcriptional regulator [Kribbella speibonae]